MSDFIKIDLHVHTPSSYDYKGNKDDNEYFSLLKQFHDLDFKLIAITDHNTVDGYFKMVELKKEKREALQMLKKMSNPDYVETIKKIEIELSIADSIFLIPGIEIDVKPGIHLNILFNPEWCEKDIRDLVDTIVSPKMKTCRKEEVYLHAIEIIDLLDLLEGEDLLVVASHFDGEKGIYGLDKNGYRASIFSHSRLDAIEYLSESNKNKVKNIFLESKEYQREVPVAYIQSSDFHGIDPGKRFSFVKKMDELVTFDLLKKAFSNPSIYVSNTETPENMTMIEELIRNSSNVILRNSLEDDDLNIVISALLNSYNGVLIVGVEYYDEKQTTTWKGINLKREEFIDMIEESLEKLGFSYPIKKHLITIELSSGKNAYLLDFKAPRGSTSIGDKYYLIKERKIIEGDYDGVIEASREKTRSIADDLYLVKQEKIENLLKEIKLVSAGSRYVLDYIDVFSNTIELRSVANKFVYGNSTIPNSTSKFDGLGNHDGKLLVIGDYGPRLKDAILRMTCPKMEFKISDYPELKESYSMKLYNGGYLIITQNYSSFIINSKETEYYLSPSNEYEFYMVLSQEETDLSIYFLAAWLKSVIFAWYVIEEGLQMDVCDFGNLPVPKNISKTDKKKIIRLVKKIYSIEEEFIKEFQLVEDEKKNTFIDEHNSKINRMYFQIDYMFLSSMNLGQNQFDYLKKVMKFNDYYCYEDLLVVNK